ncbi:MAG: type II toxin-antitoxin system Phd/YefM family antitoxin [Anaerolineae bacterium]|uniref:type II toxin-antitoxin system Phd/YefM family antitoxin n=1 Tax=Candidatus Amarolinea dominans TaxID=3140696 RepID=UPI001DE92927|nr:type II toxin-antitoxin system Phd/YefM family antitoxin [Anaerolineae bacterium]MBK9095074.1 type II toxin-antitoxin system Phd/YefM family antitoxin [Anaerolineae bacterium]
MTQVWQLQEAKSRFSEVVEEAVKNGPQLITKRGVDTAIVLSFADYRRLLLHQKKLLEFFRISPLVGVDLDLRRDTSPLRNEEVL